MGAARHPSYELPLDDEESRQDNMQIHSGEGDTRLVMAHQEFDDGNKRYEELSISAAGDADRNDDEEPVQNINSHPRKDPDNLRTRLSPEEDYLY